MINKREDWKVFFEVCLLVGYLQNYYSWNEYGIQFILDDSNEKCIDPIQQVSY